MEKRRVDYRAAEHPVDRHAKPSLGFGRHRDTPTLGLEPEQPAPGRGNTNRTSAVGAERSADEAGGYRRPAAAAGAAWGTLQVPRIARRAEGWCLGERPDAQLGHIGLADHDRAGLAQLAHDLGIRGRGDVAVGVAAERGYLAGDIDVVLDGDRHTEQRAAPSGAAARVGLVGFEQRALGEHDAEGIQLPVEALDPPEVKLDQLT